MNTHETLTDNTRGVSPVVGTVLIMGFVITVGIGLTMFGAAMINDALPADNAEFQYTYNNTSDELTMTYDSNTTIKPPRYFLSSHSLTELPIWNHGDNVTVEADPGETVEIWLMSTPSGNVQVGEYHVPEEPEPTPPANTAPTANYTITEKGNSGNVELDAAPSNDTDGTITTYEWDVGDDGTVDYTGETVQEKIPSGTNVTLTVTDNDGATDTITKTVTTDTDDDSGGGGPPGGGPPGDGGPPGHA